MDTFYNPFTYQPKVQSYFLARPMPPEVSRVAQANPQAANHIMSIWEFSQWLNQTMPTVYSAIKSQNPALLDPGTVVIQGKLSVPVFYANPPTAPRIPSTSAGRTQVAGLGSLAGDESATGIITAWGNAIRDLASQYVQADQQKKLLDLNIKLAEQGRSPVSSTDLASGALVSADTMKTLGILALVAFVGVAALKSFGRR